MRILFIGGNGNISWYCTHRAIEHGHEVWQLNREQSVLTRRKVQPEVHKLKGDMREIEQIRQLMEHASFDVVCDFICFNAQQAEADIDIFRGKTKHFFFISSDSVYKDSSSVSEPYTEDSALYDVETCDCDYIAGKLEAEQSFQRALAEEGFPVTIVRPAYTYDTIFPISIGHNCFTAEELILKGYPLLIAGDGNNLWPFTHSSDFASAFVGLIENRDTVGECFHIGSDELLTWNEQSEIVLRTLHAEKSGVFHVPYQDALNLNSIQPREMMVQRMRPHVLCTNKVKAYVPNWQAVVPFERGIRETVNWLHEDPVHKRHVERIASALMDVYRQYGITAMARD